ncbi:hypothetical protein [Mycobacterium attenuatum]|uniref:hypothetical protein n=1 Tax=Mycobacterium attenuatum TaxID=2341086 RepID=UPI000F2B5654|nr:hypothetical protein [Mycobacterium attenuatum]VBA47128.1 hypothetical protein LAUMK41_00488 [Mycobacterium attenuatum]
MTAPTAPMTAPNRADGAVASDYAGDCADCAVPVGAQGAVARSRGHPGAEVTNETNSAQTRELEHKEQRDKECKMYQDTMLPKVLTLRDFAALSSVWPEYISGVGFGRVAKSVLLARIHPNCNRLTGDEDVLARALVYTPEDEFGASSLRRLTIRRKQVEPVARDEDTQESASAYRACLYAIYALPVLELTDPPAPPFELCTACETDGSASMKDVGEPCPNCGAR